MDRAASSSQGSPQGNPSPERRSGPYPQPTPAQESGATLIAGRGLVQTVRHFFPLFNHWLQSVPDSRDLRLCTYETRFLLWWGILLYLLQLGSRRQLDFELRDGGPQVLDNVNRLAETHQTSMPVHDTLDHGLEHVQLSALEGVRFQMVQRLLRMKVFDAARLLGRPVLIIDGTGLICFHRRHCPYCLTQQHGEQTLYMHQVLEAKLLGPAGLVVSLGSEFIENADAAQAEGKSAEQVKQDCELKAFMRLMPRIKQQYPQLAFVLAMDSLYGVGPVFALTKEYHWSYVVTFKEGRTPALWKEYRTLLPLCSENTLHRTYGDGKVQEFRWVPLEYQDSEGRCFKTNGFECTETVTRDAKQEKHYFAWLSDLKVTAKTVEEIAENGGRARWKIENEGFNRQKNSGLNLTHVYSIDPEKWKSYYMLLQIAFILTQLMERGSLLRRLATQLGRPWQKLFGSLRNIARRLLESLRNRSWEVEWFDVAIAAKLRISFDNSS
jgi:hypothetical protein